ncbi:M14 family zinc carboxypeptidase [Ruania zhangjianzhongii]|uniref:M14 family zinc carboxypeptidase n=1 Tax=Ruania zhangjianzhongii TaxID=2603206 RepID=UPI0011C951F5|nr:M14 family zinc carboxypeptidase [Ruania zhangjianzhongii]
MQVDTDIPGGNALTEILGDGQIAVRPDLRDTIGNWFYWYFRVRGAAGRRLTVQVAGEPRTPVAGRGPTVSVDAGRSWRWLGAAEVHDGEFAFTVPQDCDDVRFSLGMPYTAANLDAFLARCAGRAGVVRHELTRSEQGRRVEMLQFGRIDGGAEARVLLTCRHHACEMMASHVLEGAMERILAADDPASRWLFEHVEFVVVPFVDTDGVEAGDQGKNRAPHDHGRDYGPAEGRYASVRAIRDLLREPQVRPFDVVLDLHCPNIVGRTSERIYFVGSPDADNWAAVQLLAEELEQAAVGPLPYRRANDLPFGTAWNVAGNFVTRDERAVPQQSIGWFLDDEPAAGMHAILEFPYANAEGAEVNATTSRAFGADLAQAIERYLRRRVPTSNR